MLTIDGSLGEGGGQVLRTSLSLSAITGRPFTIHNIRANRTPPGLKPQHIAAVRAVAATCNAHVIGDEPGSMTLEFRPNTSPAGGEYFVDVVQASPSGRSAGAVTLIFQAVLWPLLFTDKPSTVTIRGGTFVPHSPPYHYLSEVARPAFARFNISVDLELSRWGWMAEGGGEMRTTITPAGGLQPVQFEPVPEEKVGGIAAVTNLPSHIPHRMARRAHNLLIEEHFSPDIRPVRERGAGPGAGIILWQSQAGFSALGRKGLPADKVANMAVAELLAFVDNGAAVDRYLADQLLVPMALAKGMSAFTTDRLTRHTLTNAELLRRWLKVPIKVDGELNGPGRVTVSGIK